MLPNITFSFMPDFASCSDSLEDFNDVYFLLFFVLLK